MKKVLLLVCLIGMGLLLPTAQANSSVVHPIVHRIVDVILDGPILDVTSDASTGTLTQVKVRNKKTNEVVLIQECSGYSATVDVSGLPSGTYQVKVFTTLTTYIEEFSW